MLIESVQPPAYSHIHQVEHIQRNNKGNLWNLVQIHREKIKQIMHRAIGHSRIENK